jgi:hypothetical protein
MFLFFIFYSVDCIRMKEVFVRTLVRFTILNIVHIQRALTRARAQAKKETEDVLFSIRLRN